MKINLAFITVALAAILFTACPVPTITNNDTPNTPAPLGIVTFQGKAKFPGANTGSFVKLAVISDLFAAQPITPLSNVTNIGLTANVDCDFTITINFANLSGIDSMQFVMWEDTNDNGIIDSGEYGPYSVQGQPTDPLFGDAGAAYFHKDIPMGLSTPQWLVGYSYSLSALLSDAPKYGILLKSGSNI